MQFIPHKYQTYCVQRILDTPALALWLDMGLGKTVITLTAVNELKYNYWTVSKVLVVAPKKVAEATWSSEASKWEHLRMLRIATVLGSRKKRVAALNTPADIYVINRDNVQWLVDYYRNAWPFDMVVLDESSSFKNHRAKRFKALKCIRGHIQRIVELTGTPSPNSLIDLWAQIYLLDQGERLGKTISAYRDTYFNPDKRNATTVFSYRPKSGADNQVKNLLGDICVSMKAEDYLSLPDRVQVTVPVRLDSKAEAAYKKLEKEMVLQVDESTIDAGGAAILTNKLLQLCNGSVYDDMRQAVTIHECKLEALLELVEGLNGQHALVFYNFKHDLDRIKPALIKTGLRVREMKNPTDQENWNAGKVDILLAHPASCAYGLNLQQGGHHAVWYGLQWSLELYQQANKRLHRQGQTEPVIIHHLVVQGGVDETVMAALEGKAATQDALLDALKARIQRIKNL